MNKQDLIKLLESSGIPFNEGISSEENKNLFPRLIFWEFIWDPQSASGGEYNTVVTYQVSVFAHSTRDPKLLELKDLFLKEGIKPVIQHDYNQEDRHWESFFAVDILENL